MFIKSTSLRQRSLLETEEQNSLNSMEFVNPREQLPYVSIVVPAYNEAAIIQNNLEILYQYLESLESQYRWELIIVNDGSTDNTGDLAQNFAHNRQHTHVVNNITNSGLGQALKSGFEYCQGDYIITLDIDLSYSPQHIEQLLAKIQQTKAQIVLTSPYMKGGKASNVPWFRLFLSVCANKFLSFMTQGKISTLTSMVRVYEAGFLHTLNLKSTGMDINPEVIHKAMLLAARIEEIPAHLCWLPQKVTQGSQPSRRKSGMKLLRHTWKTLYYGFLFRPAVFFTIPSFILLIVAFYVNVWILIYSWINYQKLAQTTEFPDWNVAVAAVFQQAPHFFLFGGMMLILAIQLFGFAVLSVLGKRLFEEIFNLGTAMYRASHK